jgi:hypothetical protein
MNQLISWRRSTMIEPATHTQGGDWGLQGSAHDFRGRVYNLASPIVKTGGGAKGSPWNPQYGFLQPFTVPQRIPNPSPGVRKLTQQRGPQRTLGPLVFSPAGMASINIRGY